MSTDLLKLAPPFDLHYRDIQLYGAGAQAEVYSAWYTQFRQPVRVAIKVLNPEGCGGGSFDKLRERFLGEAEVLCGVTHPHVVRVFQVVEATLRNEPTMGFVMEWLPTTFALLLRKHPDGLPPADFKRYLEQALQGLGALHEAGVAVRDLRPANLLLSEQGQLKLADLGMARTESVALSLREQSTRFQAPEILDGSLRLSYRLGKQDPPASAYFASDLYSLGVIFHEAAVGAGRWRQLPVLATVYGEDGPGSGLPEDRRWETWHTNKSLELPPVCSVCPGIPSAVGRAIDGMVRKDPASRLPDVKSVLALLDDRPSRDHGVESDEAPPDEATDPDPGWWAQLRQRHGRRMVRTAVVGFVALAVVAAIGLGARDLLRPRHAEMTVTPPGIEALEVRWQGQPMVGGEGRQSFRLRAAEAGKLKITGGGAVLLDSILTVQAGRDLSVSVSGRLRVGVTFVANVPAVITVDDVGRREGSSARFDLAPGIYRYEAAAAGYTTQRDSLRVRAGGSLEVPLTLVAVPLAPVTGTITIVIEPAGLAAPWRLEGPSGFQRSGQGAMLLDGVDAGSYTVTWSGHDGYTLSSPSTLSGVLAAGRNLAFTGRYSHEPVVDNGAVTAGQDATEPAAGTIAIVVTPAGLGAGWRLTGPASYACEGEGPTVLQGCAAGRYTMTWLPLGGYRSPNGESKELGESSEIEFHGRYAAVDTPAPTRLGPSPGSLLNRTVSPAMAAISCPFAEDHWGAESAGSFEGILAGPTGSLFILGASKSGDAQILALDEAGRHFMSRTLGGSTWDEVVSACILNDTTIVTIVTTRDSHVMQLAAVSLSGAVLWQHSYDDWADEGAYTQRVFKAARGGLIVAGMAPASEKGMRLTKISDSGEEQWSRYFVGKRMRSTQAFNSIMLKDGGVLILGSGQDAAYDWTSYAIRVDSSGRKVWERSGPLQAAVAGTGTDEGGYVILYSSIPGSRGANTWPNQCSELVCYDAKGQPLWSRALDLCASTYFARSGDIVAYEDGFLVFGAYPKGPGAARIDRFGNRLWERDFSSEAGCEGILTRAAMIGRDVVAIGKVLDAQRAVRSIAVRFGPEGTCVEK